MIDQHTIDTVFGGHVHTPATSYIDLDDVIRVTPHGVSVRVV
jgi:hypothetical protein